MTNLCYIDQYYSVGRDPPGPEVGHLHTSPHLSSLKPSSSALRRGSLKLLEHVGCGNHHVPQHLKGRLEKVRYQGGLGGG